MTGEYIGGAVLGLLPLGALEALEPTTDPAKVIPLAVLGVFLGIRAASRWHNHRRPHVG